MAPQAAACPRPPPRPAPPTRPCHRAVCKQVSTAVAIPQLECPADGDQLASTDALRVFRWQAPAGTASRTLLVSACGADLLAGDPQLTVLR